MKSELKKIILIDQDGPLADFETGFQKEWKGRFPNLPIVSKQERKHFKVHEDYPKKLKSKVESIYSQPGFFLGLPPNRNGILAIQKLGLLGHKVFICTSPLQKNRHCFDEKYSWVKKYIGVEFAKNLIITEDKTLISGDVLIDDKPEIDGEKKPTWKHILFDATYNRHITDKKRIKNDWSNWESVLSSFVK